MNGFQLILALLAMTLWGCAPATPVAPVVNEALPPQHSQSSLLPTTPAPPPVAHEVKAMLEKSYRAPALHSLTPISEGDRVVKWVRRYDGVEMLSETKTVLVDGKAWETRSDRELAEPEPVRRGDLISDQRAAAACGLSRAFSEKRLRTRLVYNPVYVEIPKTAHVENATDVEWVIEKYRLAIEVINPVDSTLDLVDAYTGEVFLHAPGHLNTLTAVPGRQYPLVTIDATIDGGTIVLRDPVRVSRHHLGDGSPINGQGVVSGLPTSTTESGLKYVTNSPVEADAAFAISQAWDFFREAFGRRGLRDLPDLPSSVNNDAVVAYDKSATQLNAFMKVDPSTGIMDGIIRVNAGANNFAVLVNLEILGHEWSHGVFGADVGVDLRYKKGETGGLNEANSDFFGKLIKTRGLAFLRSQDCFGLTCLVPPIAEIPRTASAWIYGDEEPLAPKSKEHQA